MKPPWDETDIIKYISALALFYVVIFIVWLAMIAFANAHGEYAWIMQRFNSNGEPCCGPTDCTWIPETDVRLVPDGYLLPSGEIVPFKETQVSEDGKYWRCHRTNGSRRCFFAPHMGT